MTEERCYSDDDDAGDADGDDDGTDDDADGDDDHDAEGDDDGAADDVDANGDDDNGADDGDDADGHDDGDADDGDDDSTAADDDGDDDSADDDAGMERKAVKQKVGAGEEEGVKKIQVEGGGEGTGAARSGDLGAGGSGGMAQGEHNLRDGVLAGLREIKEGIPKVDHGLGDYN